MRSDVFRVLHEMVDYHLFGPGTWPADREFLAAYWSFVAKHNLELIGEDGTIIRTREADGYDLLLLSVLMGIHDLWEIPMELRDAGYIDDAEFCYIDSIDDEQRAVKVVKHYARRAYLKRFKTALQ